jgi:solute carrier family 25 citrate transporter 1
VEGKHPHIVDDNTHKRKTETTRRPLSTNTYFSFAPLCEATATTIMSSAKDNKKKNPMQQLIAGGCAGLVESSVCHPLDTIKTRMQLRKNQVESVEKRIQHSLVEPALRLKHSLQEPALRMQSLTATAEQGGGGAAATLRGLPPQTSTTHSKLTVQVKPMPGTTVATLGPIGTAKRIVQREGFLSLYKGLTAVWMGIVPKMAIRFVSFEQYKDLLADHTPLGRTTTATFTAGLMSGLTEAILVVTPAEVCKVRASSSLRP